MSWGAKERVTHGWPGQVFTRELRTVTKLARSDLRAATQGLGILTQPNLAKNHCFCQGMHVCSDAAEPYPRRWRGSYVIVYEGIRLQYSDSRAISCCGGFAIGISLSLPCCALQQGLSAFGTAWDSASPKRLWYLLAQRHEPVRDDCCSSRRSPRVSA